MKKKFIFGGIILTLFLAVLGFDCLNQNFYYSYYDALHIPEDRKLDSLVEQFGEPKRITSSTGDMSAEFDGFTAYYSTGGTFLRIEVWDSKCEFGPIYARIHVGTNEEIADRFISLKRHKIRFEGRQKRIYCW